jgi:hypothetical protein
MVIAQIIEQAARERFNEAAALVLRATLKTTETKQLSLEDVRSGLMISLFFSSIHLLNVTFRTCISSKHINTNLG